MRFAPIALLFVFCVAAAADEVRHEGKTPTEWAEELATAEKRFRTGAVEALNVHLWPYASSATPRLVEALESEEAEVRQLAAACLGRIGAAVRAEAATRLATLLGDDSRHVRCAAAKALGEIGDPASLAALQKALDDEDAELRACAALGIGLFGKAAEKAVPALTARLQDEDPSVRLRAALALVRITGQVGPSKAAIESALAPPSGPTTRTQIYLREEAIQTLGALGPVAGEMAPALTKIVETDRSFARDFAADALAALGEAGHVGIPALVDGLDDSTFRQAAAQALGRFGPAAKAAVPGLVMLLERPTWKEESAIAARALGRIGPPAAAAVPALTATLALKAGAGGVERVEAALVALGEIGEAAESATAGVRELLDSPEGRIRVAAHRALFRITGEGRNRAQSTLLELGRHDEGQTRAAALTALGDLGFATDPVRAALGAARDGDPDASVRRAAAKALARLDG